MGQEGMYSGWSSRLIEERRSVRLKAGSNPLDTPILGRIQHPTYQAKHNPAQNKTDRWWHAYNQGSLSFKAIREGYVSTNAPVCVAHGDTSTVCWLTKFFIASLCWVWICTEYWFQSLELKSASYSRKDIWQTTYRWLPDFPSRTL